MISLCHLGFDSYTINHNLFMLLRLEGFYRLAIIEERLFESEWHESEPVLPLEGLDLDSAWDSMLRHISGIDREEGVTFSEQVEADLARRELEDRIQRLRSRMATEKQHRVQRELYSQLRELEAELRNM